MAVRFKLQSVLNYRQSLEDQAQQALAASMQQRSEISGELERQGQALDGYDRELRERQKEGLTVAEIDLFESQISYCRRMMAQLQQQLEQIDLRIEEQRECLQKAARDRQIMEKLKDKKEAEFRRELTRQERAMLDEISLRNKGESS